MGAVLVVAGADVPAEAAVVRDEERAGIGALAYDRVPVNLLPQPQPHAWRGNGLRDATMASTHPE